MYVSKTGPEIDAVTMLTDLQVVASKEARTTPFLTLVSSWTSSTWSPKKRPKHPPRRQKVSLGPFLLAFDCSILTFERNEEVR